MKANECHKLIDELPFYEAAKVTSLESMIRKVDPEISVLMPVHNGALFIRESVKSILEQTFQAFELIIIDDGSTDQTPELLRDLAKADPRITLLKNERVRGISSALNLASREACGKFIARMDADDWAQQSRFELQLATFYCDPELVLCGSNATHVDANMRPFFRTVLPLTDWDIRCTALFENPFAHPTIMMRANAFHRVGGYNVGYKTAQDYELWIRLLKLGKVCNLHDRLVKQRHHGESITAQKFLIQADYTAHIQRQYAAEFLQLDDWGSDRFYNIRRHLFRCPYPPSPDKSVAIEAIHDALLIIDFLIKHCGERSSRALRSYVRGRCIWSSLRRPWQAKKFWQGFMMMMRSPLQSMKAIMQLIAAAWESRPLKEK